MKMKEFFKAKQIEVLNMMATKNGHKGRKIKNKTGLRPVTLSYSRQLK